LKVTYIYHSCFLLETEKCYYLFDYFKGSLPELDVKKPILVFASHSHGDHYNPDVLLILKEMQMEQIYAMLSDDISDEKVPEGVEHIWVSPEMEYDLIYGQKVTTLRSTDMGVAFLIQEGEQKIYHAGDLNDWVWEGESCSYNEQMTKDYRKQIGHLEEILQGQSMEAAFVVLDPRQEKDYAKGMLYFLSKIKVDKVYPMHYWEKPEIIGKFLEEYSGFEDRIVITEVV